MTAAPKLLKIPSLDGIRAVAVSIVFVAHAGLGNLIPGGFGVTIFFFLSGYLITTLLRAEFEASGTIGIGHFYLRRILRIAPPMYIVLCGSAAYVLLTHRPFNGFAFLAQALHATNYYAILADEYQLMPGTGIMWSLAVEEHYYFVYPFFLIAVLPRYSYRAIATMLGVFCLCVLAWRSVLVYGLHVGPDYTYKATDTRLDSIIYGSIMALVMNPALDTPRRAVSRPAAAAILIAALGVLGFAFLFRSEAFRETFRYTLQGLALGPIFYFAVRFPRWIGFALLNTRPVRALGLVSYTFYLTHYLVLTSVGSLIASKWTAGLMAFVVTFAISSAMYVLVERPLAGLRRRLHGNKQTSVVAAASGRPDALVS